MAQLLFTRKPVMYVNIGSTNYRRLEKLISHGYRNFMVTTRTELLWMHRFSSKFNIDVIVDNGAFKGRSEISLIRLARILGYKYIMPDVLEDSVKTFKLHVRYRDLYDRDLAFIVVQGRSVDDYLKCLDLMEKEFCVKRLAVGGLLRKTVSLRSKILAAVREVFSEHLHSLGWCKTPIVDSCDVSVIHLPRTVRGK